MNFSFVDKDGNSVFIEDSFDFAYMLEKYIGGTIRYHIGQMDGSDIIEEYEEELREMESDFEWERQEYYDDGFEAGKKAVLDDIKRQGYDDYEYKGE